MTNQGVNFHLPSGGQFSAAVDKKAENLIAIKAIDEHTRCPTTAPCPVDLHNGPVVMDRRRWRDSSDDSKDCHVADRIQTQPAARRASALNSA